ncbi:MAG: helix-turn-helix domain-containing protein [Thiolinea sp.]
MQPEYYVFQPATILRPYISLYWLAKNTKHTSYPILPDGSIDVVIKINSTDLDSQLFGTTTRPTLIAIEPNNTYLGIRFNPGQSRHFINLAASELTNLSTSSSGLLTVQLDRLNELTSPTNIATYLDQCLCHTLNKHTPATNRIDHVLQQILLSHGQLTINEAANNLCKSRRQFERIFRETVGLTPKTYSAICRLQHATQLIHHHPQIALAEIAHIAGYADQSHMNRNCKRLTGVTPTRIDHNHVAFIQYTSGATHHT